MWTFERAGAQELGSGQGLAPWPSMGHPLGHGFHHSPSTPRFHGQGAWGEHATSPPIPGTHLPANHPLVEQLGRIWGRATLAPRQLAAFRSSTQGLCLALFVYNSSPRAVSHRAKGVPGTEGSSPPVLGAQHPLQRDARCKILLRACVGRRI